MATRTWSGTTNGNWDVDANWGGTKPAAGDDLVFPASASNKSTTNDITADTSFNSITFNGSGYTLAGNRITLVAGIIQSVTSTNTISLAIILAGDQTVDMQNSGGTLTISGIISEDASARALSKASAGTLTLSGNNTFGGGVTIKAGRLGCNPNSLPASFGTGTITIGDSTGSADATLVMERSYTYANNIVVASGSSGTLSITSELTNPVLSGTITLNHNLVLGTVGSATLTLSGNIDGAYTITNSGTGSGTTTISGVIGANVTGVIQNSSTSALTISGTNTYTGPITNSAGTLNLAQSNTFSTLTLAGDTTTKVTAGKTLTLTNLVSGGSSGHLAIIKSATSSAHTLTTLSAQISVDYMDLTYSQPTETNTWYAGNNSTDNGNNGNWIFSSPGGPPSIKGISTIQSITTITF